MRTITLEQWAAEGSQKFGDDQSEWKFICPNCGHIQTAIDFHELGMPDEQINRFLGFSCIGRYIDGCKGEFGNGIAPCNYTSGGLFNIAPLTVIANGAEHHMFEFAEVKP